MTALEPSRGIEPQLVSKLSLPSTKPGMWGRSPIRQHIADMIMIANPKTMLTTPMPMSMAFSARSQLPLGA